MAKKTSRSKKPLKKVKLQNKKSFKSKAPSKDTIKTQVQGDFVSVYITAPDRDIALKVAQTLVEEKLCACFNIIENVTSVYTWHNELEKSTEVAMIGKTKAHLMDKIIKRAKELHSYEVPCICFWPIVSGFPLYLEWLKANTIE